MSKVNFLILSGDGLNCERDCLHIVGEAGGHGTIVHINDLIETPELLTQSDALVLPGGFSYGDELGSGQILALKIKQNLKSHLDQFIQAKKPVIGICNGFQILAKLGYFTVPNQMVGNTVGLTQNMTKKFINKWVDVNLHSSKCIWTAKNIPSRFSFPIRHGEGRVVFSAENNKNQADEFMAHEQVVLTYVDDINGSDLKIAGICNETGTVFGLMPHPEADVIEGMNPSNNPQSIGPSVGYEMFENCINYIQRTRHESN